MLYVQLMQSAACRAIKKDIFKLEFLIQAREITGQISNSQLRSKLLMYCDYLEVLISLLNVH